MQRLGILFVAIFLILEGFANVLLGAGMILAKENFYELMKEEFKKALKDLNATHLIAEEIFDTAYDVISFATILIGALYLIIALAIIALKSWARVLAVILLVFQLAYSLATVHVDPTSILGVAISVALIWYLSRKDVREMFSGKKTTIEERILGRKI
ncbi:MAG: hypothetical protein QXW59_01770 [Archaeoglobaceae archaeon]